MNVHPDTLAQSSTLPSTNPIGPTTSLLSSQSAGIVVPGETSICRELSEDGDIVRRKDEASKKLIQKPLVIRASEPDCSTLVLLLEGLDEYDNELASKLLHVIGKGIDALPSAIRLIITSRPKPHLTRLYEREPMKSNLEIRSLDLEDQKRVEKDIEKFLQQKLPEMVWGWVENPWNWPGIERRRALVRLSQGLWIWAGTVARMLADPNYRNPEQQLETQSTPPGPTGTILNSTQSIRRSSTERVRRAAIPTFSPCFAVY